MATVAEQTSIAADHLMLWTVSWEAYVGISDLLMDQPVRFTYDRGRLEIRTPSRKHERCKHLLALFVTGLAEELVVDVNGGGSMTFRREDLDRGLEPDECFWVQNEAVVRARDTLDLTVDPPPDLVIEVEVSRAILDRVKIYAALGVPEVWRFDGQALHVLQLQADNKYTELASSATFPGLRLAEMARLVQLRTQESNTTLARLFRTWVKAEIAAGRLTRTTSAG